MQSWKATLRAAKANKLKTEMNKSEHKLRNQSILTISCFFANSKNLQ